MNSLPFKNGKYSSCYVTKDLLISAPLADINQTPKLYGFALKILNTK